MSVGSLEGSLISLAGSHKGGGSVLVDISHCQRASARNLLGFLGMSLFPDGLLQGTIASLFDDVSQLDGLTVVLLTLFLCLSSPNASLDEDQRLVM
jgi:hypothetical protein